MKAFTIFAMSITTVASAIVIGNFVRSLMADAKADEKKAEG